MRTSCGAAGLAGALLALLPAMAAAQVGDAGVVDAGAGETTGGLSRSNAVIGLGIGLAPDYEGSSNYEGGLVPFARFSWAEHAQYLSLAPDPGSRTYQLRVNVLPEIGLELGPLLAYRAGRRHVDNNDVNRLPNTDNAWEVGGFLRWGLPIRLPGRQGFALEASGAADASGAHDGWWAQPALAYRRGIAEGWTLSARTFADYASGDYMDEYFSINSGQATRSGLRDYDADAGWKDVGGTLGIEWQFAQHWATGATGTYKRMIGDAGSSPVTRSAGNKNQGSGGIFIAYRF